MKTHFLFIILLFIFLSCKKNEPTPANSGTPAPTAPGGSKAGSVTDNNGNVYEIGYKQVSGNNQDPWVTKKDKTGKLIWSNFYSDKGADDRGHLIILDNEGNLWATFSTVGGDNNFSSKNAETGAFSGVYRGSYGNGGGPKASIIAKIDPNTGKIKKGTFLVAVLPSTGKVNSLSINSISVSNDKVILDCTSAATPPKTGKSYAAHPDATDDKRVNGYFHMLIEFKKDLSEIVTSNILNY